MVFCAACTFMVHNFSCHFPKIMTPMTLAIHRRCNLCGWSSLQQIQILYVTHHCALQWRIQDFPWGGHPPRRGVPTPKAAAFQKICVSKWKNLDPWGAGRCNKTRLHHVQLHWRIKEGGVSSARPPYRSRFFRFNIQRQSDPPKFQRKRLL